MRRVLFLSAALGLALLACGGKAIIGGDDGGTDSSEPLDATPGGDVSEPDAPSPPDAPGNPDSAEPPDAPVTKGCKPTSSVAEGSDGMCAISWMKTCSDGTTYSVECNCPENMCNCSQSSAMSGSGAIVSYGACPDCSVASALKVCNFSP